MRGRGAAAALGYHPADTGPGGGPGGEATEVHR
jgi:hypothetical protein